mmetsp:Transcript_24502/g.24743  ORF Transcript_24502/g.24743 Transcript_24502/m.24743 type:complete len:244 (-) Transcript_24502:49-780(-)
MKLILALVMTIIVPSQSMVIKSSIMKIARAPRNFATALVIGFSLSNNIPMVHADEVQINGLKKGSLLTCKTQSNCVSTSSVKSVDKYSRPWTTGSDDYEKSWKDLKAAVSASKDLKIAVIDEDNHYIRAEAKSALPPLGIDDVEFLLNTRDNIVTYRSNSRDLVYAGTQLIGDGGANKNRLETVRRRLGWTEMGVEKEMTDYIKMMDKTSFIKRIQMASEPSDVNFLDNSVPIIDSSPVTSNE